MGAKLSAGHGKPLVTSAIGSLAAPTADLHTHWIGCTLEINDFRKEPSVWNAIARNDEETDEQALLLHVNSSGDFPTEMLRIGAELEPFSCFKTQIDYMVFAHIALPKYTKASHEEFYSNAMKAVINESDPSFRNVAMRPLLGARVTSQQALDAWVQTWTSISSAD